MDLAEVVRRHGPAYLERFGQRMPQEHRAALEAILRCHTPACGGSLYVCPNCGELHFSYHGCGHRACGQCGQAQALAWLERQTARLLPVEYFLATFTIPEALRGAFRHEQRFFYDLLLRESAATLQDVAAQPRYLQGRLGLLAVLHTWSRQLIYHPHVHFVIPGVALCADGALRWPNQPQYLLPVQRLSARMRARMRQALEQQRPELYAQIAWRVWREPWVVHLEHAGKGPQVLAYLSRYIYKTAISNARLLSQDDQNVSFSYRDSQTGENRSCTLSGEEFLRRFLQHVLPKGFRRVRTYGWLSPAAKTSYEEIAAMLGALTQKTKAARLAPPVLCPNCGQPLHRLGELSRAPP